MAGSVGPREEVGTAPDLRREPGAAVARFATRLETVDDIQGVAHGCDADALYLAGRNVNVKHAMRRESFPEYSWTNETRLVSDLGGPFRYVAGIYFETIEAPFTSALVIRGLNDAISPPLPPLLPSVPGGDELLSVVSTRDNRQLALFGEATYALGERFELTGGLRRFSFDSESTDTFSGFQFGGNPASNPAIERTGSGSSDGFTPKLVLSYHASTDQLFFGLVAKGCRSGGSNIPLPSLCDADLIASGITPPAPSEFKPDSLWNYEAGAKMTGLDRRLTARIERLAGRLPMHCGRRELQPLPPPGGARNALACALRDLEAKADGQGIWKLTGVRARPLETVYTIGLEPTPRNMAEHAAAASA